LYSSTAFSAASFTYMRWKKLVQILSGEEKGRWVGNTGSKSKKKLTSWACRSSTGSHKIHLFALALVVACPAC
jgi:hypothetical protein